MRVTKNNKDLFKFLKNTKNSFINVCKKEVETMKSVKIQFSINVRFFIYRNEEKEEMDHYFDRMQPAILNKHNIDIIKPWKNRNYRAK